MRPADEGAPKLFSARGIECRIFSRFVVKSMLTTLNAGAIIKPIAGHSDRPSVTASKMPSPADGAVRCR
jgi:hypothetical protein